MKVNNEWKDYKIIATSKGEKLEMWGDVCLLRPDPQIIWDSGKDLSKYAKLNAHYKRESTGGGHWETFKAHKEQWTISWRDLKFIVKPMGFKHTGVFPEQAVNWAMMIDLIKKANRPIKILNLFAYTGGATVACSSAGAEVTHVDASKGIEVGTQRYWEQLRENNVPTIIFINKMAKENVKKCTHLYKSRHILCKKSPIP